MCIACLDGVSSRSGSEPLHLVQENIIQFAGLRHQGLAVPKTAACYFPFRFWSSNHILPVNLKLQVLAPMQSLSRLKTWLPESDAYMHVLIKSWLSVPNVLLDASKGST